MGILSRMSNGWKLTKTSLRIINENKSLLLFPLLSGLSLIMILATFWGGTFYYVGDDIARLLDDDKLGQATAFLMIFVYYLINFFIVIFFNAALIHCAIKILKGEDTSLGDGLGFAASRIGRIFLWSVVSATVGMLLQMLQNSGKVGEIISGLLGFAWSIMTFFVVPIIIYENKGVFASIKESTLIIKEKWGESLVSNMSLGFFHFLGIALGILLIYLLAPVFGIWAFALGLGVILLVTAIISAARTIFVAAIYNSTEGLPTSYFSDDVLDAAFVLKK